jgi:hypothetical protein
MKYINNDDEVTPLTEQAKEALDLIAKHFSIDKDVYIFETIHGHLVNFGKRCFYEDSFSLRASLLSINDMRFLCKFKGIRKISHSYSKLTVAFTNKELSK